MEEVKKEEPSKSILSVLKGKKKEAVKKEVTKSSKDKEAAAKVQELLKDTPVAALVGAESSVPAKKEFDMEEHKQERSQKWLEDQVNELNRQVEEYENEILYYKEEINKLNEFINMKSSVGGGLPNQPTNPNVIAPNGHLEHNVLELYRHFENVLFKHGNVSVKLTFPESGNGVLDKFLEYFPHLTNYKRFSGSQFM